MTRIEALEQLAESVKKSYIPEKDIYEPSMIVQALKAVDDAIDEPVDDSQREPSEPICPECGIIFVAQATVRDIAICRACGATLVVRDNTLRPAKYSDLESLQIAEMAILRRGRGAVARPERRRRQR